MTPVVSDYRIGVIIDEIAAMYDGDECDPSGAAVVGYLLEHERDILLYAADRQESTDASA